MTALNPGHLKLALALQGIHVDGSARSHPELSALPVHSDGSLTIELLLPEDVVVDAPVHSDDSHAGRTASYQLTGEAHRFFVHHRGDAAERVEVRVIPPPGFYARQTPQGTPMREIGAVFGGFIALSPIESCGFGLRRRPCHWCAGQAAADPPPIALSIEEVVDTVRAAFAEGAVESVLFNTGADDTDDGGVAALEPYIRAVKRHFDTFVAVQAHPPKGDRWIDRTYAMGVDALSYSIEVHDADVLARLCPGRVAHIGRQRYYDTLAYAATIFPSGTVWSDLVVGLEPLESTRDGLDALIRVGVLPVLSLSQPRYVPQGNPILPVSDTALLAEVSSLFAHLFHAVRRAKITMDWVQELSFGVTPLEARFFAGEDARLSVTQHFYRSRLGTLTARNLARLRRRLRVRTVSDSFDSSQL